MTDAASLEIVARPARHSSYRPDHNSSLVTNQPHSRENEENISPIESNFVTSEITLISKSEYQSTLQYIHSWGKIKSRHLSSLAFVTAKEQLGIFTDQFVVTSNWESGQTLSGELASRKAPQSTFTSLEQLSLLYGIVVGLSNLHKHGLCHGNIRPEYVLVKKTENRHIKSSLLPNLEAVGAPYITAQRIRLANDPKSVTYADNKTTDMLTHKRGPWVVQDPNKDLQLVGWMFLVCFPHMSPVVAQLVEMLISVPDEPTDWSAAGRFSSATGPLSEQGLKARIKQAMEIDRDDMSTPKSPSVSVEKVLKTIEYERTPPVKITAIEGKDLSSSSRKARLPSQDKKHFPINLLSSPEKQSAFSIRDERNSSGNHSGLVDLTREEDSKPLRRPVTEWTTDLIELGRPNSNRTKNPAKSQDRQISEADSNMYDSMIRSGRKVTSIDLNEAHPAGGLESSRYTIQMMPEGTRPSAGAEFEYFQHAESIKQQIQTYGPKDHMMHEVQRLDFEVEESPVLTKKSARPEESMQPGILIVPFRESIDDKNHSRPASGYYNSSYYGTGSNTNGAAQVTSSVWESQNSLVKTVGKYTDYSPPSMMLK